MAGFGPRENLVFDPEYTITNVTEYTHYLPNHWRGRLHTNEVRADFAMLYQMKVVIFLEELLSILFTPLILWISLPKCSDRLVDFFREFTIHVDGLGMSVLSQCSISRKEATISLSVMAQQHVIYVKISTQPTTTRCLRHIMISNISTTPNNGLGHHIHTRCQDKASMRLQHFLV